MRQARDKWLCMLQVSFGPISWLIVGEIFPLAGGHLHLGLLCPVIFANFGALPTPRLDS